MNSFNLVKRVVLSALAILYDIVTLFWCYILLKSLVFSFSLLCASENSIGIIGGADVGLMFFSKWAGVLIFILFILLSIANTTLLSVCAFKKQVTRKIHILLCVLLTLSFIIYLFIPIQTYLIPLSLLVDKMPLLKHMRIIYIILSLGAVVKNALLTVRKECMQI